MRDHPTWNQRLQLSHSNEVFAHLMNTLTPSIKTFDYFIDWSKARKYTKAVDRELNLLNSLVGKNDVRSELDSLLQEYPNVVRAFPTLFAFRMEEGKKKISSRELAILVEFHGGDLKFDKYDLTPRANLTKDQRQKIVEFAAKIGILDLFESGVARSIPDYAFGVEVGIDTNGRKNRGGKLMERILSQILEPICQRNSWKLMDQPTKKKLNTQWGIELAIAKTNVRPDAAVQTPHGLWLIETNFFNEQGSKLKATAGEYRGKANWCKEQKHGYLWVTDGTGWNTSRAALHECFESIDYLLNLEMCISGCLEDVLSGEIP